MDLQLLKALVEAKRSVGRLLQRPDQANKKTTSLNWNGGGWNSRILNVESLGHTGGLDVRYKRSRVIQDDSKVFILSSGFSSDAQLGWQILRQEQVWAEGSRSSVFDRLGSERHRKSVRGDDECAVGFEVLNPSKSSDGKSLIKLWMWMSSA